MKLTRLFFLMVALSSFGWFGCAHNKSSLLPVHDEVLTFSLPLDLAYLRTLDAIQAHPDWDLDRTVKEQGLIYLRNQRYSSFADADQRTATLIIKQVGPRKTTVRLAPESQSVVGGDEILKLVKDYLSLEVSRRVASGR